MPVHVRVADLDGVNHVNHTVYADLLDDAVARAGGAEAIRAHPRTYDLQYKTGIRPGDEIREAAWRADGVWCYRIERGDGHLVMHGRLREGAAPFDP
jgi:acyl-ACP thioesterase